MTVFLSSHSDKRKQLAQTMGVLVHYYHAESPVAF